MIHTKIYRRYQLKKMALLFIGLLSVYVLLCKPVLALKGREKNTPIEKPSIVQTVDDSQDVFKKLAIPIPAEELYDIFTRSNELIQIVDARSEEEYKEAHISAAKSLESFKKNADNWYNPIRVFFYSNDNDRSKDIANFYANKGIKAYYVVGGLHAWEQMKGLTYIERS